MARRKQSDQSERQTVNVSLWITPSERADLDKRVAEAGVTLSEYARASLFGFSIIKKEPIDGAILKELWAAGTNLNQIAHRFNAIGQYDQQELNEALRLWSRIVERLGE